MVRLRIEERYKSISIPVTFIDGVPYYLTVRDKRFKDWIFIAGGCRKRETHNPLKCALRELEEETRGILSLSAGEYSSFKFRTWNRTKEEISDDMKRGVQVISVYHCYIFFLNIDKTEMNNIVTKFNEAKRQMEIMKENRMPIKRTHDENDLLKWDTLDDFKKRKQWDVIKIHVLENNDFKEALHTKKRAFFNSRRNINAPERQLNKIHETKVLQTGKHPSGGAGESEVPGYDVPRVVKTNTIARGEGNWRDRCG